jgi:simple sugar transport system permease protein
MLGAYFFGVLTALAPNLQARQINVAPSEVFDALPYGMTIVVLVVISSQLARHRFGAPAALGQPYIREER